MKFCKLRLDTFVHTATRDCPVCLASDSTRWAVGPGQNPQANVCLSCRAVISWAGGGVGGKAGVPVRSVRVVTREGQQT